MAMSEKKVVVGALTTPSAAITNDVKMEDPGGTVTLRYDFGRAV
jgi:hypothetical protein